jgi:hypothetical protein
MNHAMWVLQVVRDFDDTATVSVFHLCETQTDVFGETLWCFGWHSLNLVSRFTLVVRRI